MIDLDPTTQLILNVGNVIHDDVCMALSRVNFKELEDAPHSDRVDAAAAKIIAMIEQDVARRLLSDVTAMCLERDIKELAEAGLADDYRAMAELLAKFAAGYIGITVEPQP